MHVIAVRDFDVVLTEIGILQAAEFYDADKLLCDAVHFEQVQDSSLVIYLIDFKALFGHLRLSEVVGRSDEVIERVGLELVVD